MERFHSSINHRSWAKAGNLLRNGDQPAAQPAKPDRYVYHMIATKDRAHLCRGQNDRSRQTAPGGADLPAPAFRPIEREDQQANFAGSHRVTDLLEPGNRETSPTGKTNHVQAPLHQQGLDAIREPGRYNYRPMR